MLKFMIASALVLACAKTGDAGDDTGGTTTDAASTTGASAAPTSTDVSAGTEEASSSAPTTTGDEPGSLAMVLAVDELFFGDTAPGEDGWKRYGMNIDGKVSTEGSVDLCKPASNAPAESVYPDGDGGIDNSFGKNIFPILSLLAADFSTRVNARIQSGEWTIMLAPADPGQAPSLSFPTWLLAGADLGAPPKFDGTDAWPIDPASLVNPGDPASAKCQYSETKAHDDELMTGPGCSFDLALSVVGLPLVLPLRGLRLCQVALSP